MDHSADGTLAWPLERAATRFRDEEAVVEGATCRTYGELAARVARLGAGLGQLGVTVGERVGVLSANNASYLECALGIPRVGAVLNALNTRLAPAELELIAVDSGLSVLFCDAANLEVARRLADRCPSLHTVVGFGPDAPEGTVAYASMLLHGEAPPADLEAEALATISYTGGTTGRPKGVMLSHRNLLTNAKHLLAAVPFTAVDRYLHAPPMFHAADAMSTLALTWTGGTHVMIPGFEPELVTATIEAERVTLTVLVPTMINMVVNHPTAPHHDLSSLRLLMYGASAMPDDLRRRAQQVFACDWAQLYGMTEAAPAVTLLGPEDHRRGVAGEEPYASRLRSAGAPIAGVQAEVRRIDGSPAPPHEPGEVWVRGPNMMLGYWQRPEETAAALADGWYHTGDMAYADEHGFLYIVDRLKDMIISGGENVYSSEVENALYGHPSVIEAAVIGVPDELWGERVHAVVVVPVAPVDADALMGELQAHCRTRLAGFKVPRSLEVRTDPLPKSGAGKILKRDLRAPHWEGH